MFHRPEGQKIMYTTSFLGKVCRKNPGFDKGKTAGMFGLTLYDLASFISLYVYGKVQKYLLKIKLLGLAHQSSLVSPCQSFPLSPSLSFSG